MTSLVTLGVGGYIAAALQQMTGTFDRWAQFGPHDGLLTWLLLGLVAWTLAHAGVRRQRGRLEGAAEHLFAFLGLHALVFVVGLAGAAFFFPGAGPIGLGCMLGLWVLLPLGFLSPWAAARGLMAQQESDADPFSSALWGWASLVLWPLRILGGTVTNLVLLGAVGFPIFSVLEKAPTSFETWLLFWLGILALGATHVQFSVGALAAAEAEA
jgi:hypothetical protein